jgi:cytochrome c biogenesis protein CcdA
MAEPVLAAFAFTAGLLSFVNPCGIAMLPAYISYFLGREEEGSSGVGNPGDDLTESASRAVGKGLYTGGVTSLGFVVVFVSVGGAIGVVGGAVIGNSLPYIVIGLGAVLIALGLAMFMGWNLYVRLPVFSPKGRGFVSFFLFGIAYALASLSCTMAIFLLVVVGALAQGGPAGAAIIFLIYALGLGVFMIFVSVLSALSKDVLVSRVRSLSRYVPKVSAAVLVVAGVYLIAYWLQFV